VAGMVVPLVLFFSLLAVVGTCWYYRRRNSKTVNMWESGDEDQVKRDKTRVGEGGEHDEISSSGGIQGQMMINDMAEKKRQKQGLLDNPMYTI
jgi:hypothetical protein